jgi:hypothetical protein
MAQSTTALRSYRIYLRDPNNVFERPHEVDLASDQNARDLAMRMLGENAVYLWAEVWERARLVGTVRKG